jgi:thiosulfate dehydrogenase
VSKFWSGVLVGVILFVVLVVAVVYTGMLPAAANDPSMRFEPLIAQAGLAARIARQAPNRDVSSTSTADLVAGAGVYQNNCAACHGLPNQEQGPVGAGMFPTAPRLFSPDGMVTDDSAGETYWKVKNGIRLSGMPSFEKVLTDEQIWDVAAVVKRADRLPADVMDTLKPQPAPPTQQTAPPNVPPAKSTP